MFKKYKEKFIGDREFYANLIRLIIPMIVQQGITSFVSLLDNVMVGRLGTESMSGVAIVNQLLFVFNLTIFGGLAGASIFGAQFYGKGDHKGVRYALRFKLIFSVLMAVIAIVALLFFNNPLISLFLTESESGGDLVLTLSEAKNYLFVMLIGLIPFSFSQSYSTTLRETGETVSPMTASIIAIVTNFVLNYILIFGSFGAPRLGVVGAAIATVISQCISAALVVRCLMKETGPLRLDFRQLKIYPIKLKQIMQVGIPAGIQGMLFSLANVTVQSSVNSFGEVIMAGSSAAISIEQFIYSNINAFYQANVAFTSQNYGAGDYRRIKKIARISVVTGVVTTELLSVLAVYFGPQLLGIYSPSAEVVAAGMVRLRWIALFYGLDAIMDVIVGSLRGVGYNILPMLVTLMGACASRLIWLSTVFRLPAYHRIEMVYIVYPLSWALTATTHLICYFFVSRKVDRELRAHEAELAARMEESPEEADS